MSEVEVKSKIEHLHSIICSIEFQVNRIDPTFAERTEIYAGEKEDFIKVASVVAWRKRLDFDKEADVYFEIKMTDYVQIGLEALASS